MPDDDKDKINPLPRRSRAAGLGPPEGGGDEGNDGGPAEADGEGDAEGDEEYQFVDPPALEEIQSSIQASRFTVRLLSDIRELLFDACGMLDEIRKRQ